MHTPTRRRCGGGGGSEDDDEDGGMVRMVQWRGLKAPKNRNRPKCGSQTLGVQNNKRTEEDSGSAI